MDTRLLLLLFSLLSFSSLSSAAIRCHPNDYQVLVNMKAFLNNPAPDSDCCDWNYIECDKKTNRVTTLRVVESTEFSGQIPPGLGDLSYLQVLELIDVPNLTGSIPYSITKLQSLRMLRITYTNVTGPVPDFLSQLHQLRFLDLTKNKLYGLLPPSLSKLTKLQTLILDGNKLIGSIPNTFGEFTSLVHELGLADNQLSGTIPNSLGNLNVGRINLSRNKLVGDASMLFKPNGNTYLINLSWNKLAFDLSKAKFPLSLTSLELDHNKIYGSIPKGLNGLKSLTFLSLGYNRLCGEIPRGGSFDRFDATSYIPNPCLCGLPLKNCK